MSVFLNPLIEWLKCLLLFLVGCILWVLEQIINLMIWVLVGLESLAMALLPTYELPKITWPSYFANVNLFLPLDEAMLALTLVISTLLIWPLVRFILNWAKGD